VFSYHHHHHHHTSVMELEHLLTCSGLTYPEVSSKVCHDFFCQSGNSVSLPWVIYDEAFYLHVVSIFSCIPTICPKLVLFLTLLQFVYLFCNLSERFSKLFKMYISVKHNYLFTNYAQSDMFRLERVIIRLSI